MTLTAYRTDEGIEIRDDDSVVAEFNTWPPRDADSLDDLFDEGNISTPQKELFRILFGVDKPIDERDTGSI